MSSAIPAKELAAQLALAQYGFVKALAIKLAPWPGLGEDIAQQVLLQFITHAERWDLATDIRPLLATMTRNESARQWRVRRREMAPEIQDLADHIQQLAAEGEENPRWEDEKAALQGCLEKLPEKSRLLVNLRYYGGASSLDIAGQMEMKTDTVRQALHRVREQLRICIERSLGGEVPHV